MRKRLALLLSLGLVAGLAPAAAEAESIVGLALDSFNFNLLVRFDSATPGVVSSPVAITGLVGGSGETVIGIDYRPADGALVAVTRQDVNQNVGRGRVYTLDATTGAASLIYGSDGLRDASGNEVLLAATNSFSYGVDFNPVANALRIVSTSQENLRISMGGTGVTFVDAALNGPSGAAAPNINAVAYSNNAAGATSTTLYALDIGVDRIRTIGGLLGSPSPNTGKVFDVAPSPPGLSITNNVGFDISGVTGIAYASFRNATNGFTDLYTIDLATGGGTRIGAINSTVSVRDIAVAAVPEPGTLAMLGLGLSGLAAFARSRRLAGPRGRGPAA